MDPLSIAASIAGLLALAGKIVSSMASFTSSISTAPRLAQQILSETQSLTLVFAQLQSLLEQRTQAVDGRTALISVDQLSLVLTGCVVAFSELEVEVDELGAADDMGWWDRAKWGQKENDLTKLLQRLEGHKTSLGLMLTILLCRSNAEAERTTSDLAAQVERLMECNEKLMALMQDVRPSTSRNGVSIDVESIETAGASHVIRFNDHTMVAELLTSSRQEPTEVLLSSPFRFEFEDTLYKTRVYTRTLMNSTSNSFKSVRTSHTLGSKWTQLTGLSLAQISNISVIHLPIYPSDIPGSAHWFKFRSSRSGAGPPTKGGQSFEDELNMAFGLLETTQDDGDTETIRETSLNRTELSIIPSASGEVRSDVSASFLHPRLHPYLIQTSAPVIKNEKLLSLSVSGLNQIISAVIDEIGRRELGEGSNLPTAISAGPRGVLAKLPDQGLCDLVGDLDLVLKIRQLRLPFLTNAELDWPLTPSSKLRRSSLKTRPSSLPNLRALEKVLFPMAEDQPEPAALDLPTAAQLSDAAVRGYSFIEPPEVPSEQLMAQPKAYHSRAAEPIASNEGTRVMTLGLFGESCTGKSQLLTQSDDFYACRPTIEDHVTRLLQGKVKGEAIDVVLDMLDTGGAYEYQSLIPGWIIETHLFVLMYRPDLPGSWNFVQKLLPQIRELKGPGDDIYPVMIFENTKAGPGINEQEWAHANGCGFVSGSALDRGLVDGMFLELARKRIHALMVARMQLDDTSEPPPERVGIQMGGRMRRALMKKRISTDWMQPRTKALEISQK